MTTVHILDRSENYGPEAYRVGLECELPADIARCLRALSTQSAKRLRCLAGAAFWQSIADAKARGM